MFSQGSRMDITGTGRSSQQAYVPGQQSKIRSLPFHDGPMVIGGLTSWSCFPLSQLLSTKKMHQKTKRAVPKRLHHTAGCERGRQWRKALALLFDMDLFSIEKDWVKISVHGRMFLLTFWWRTASHSTENTNFSAENSRILWYSWDHWNKHNG